MINEINMNKINANMYLQKADSNGKKAADAIGMESADVKVTNHLSSLVNLIGSDHQVVDNKAKINDLKLRIENNSYKIDLEKLSDNLLNSGLFI